MNRKIRIVALIAVLAIYAFAILSMREWYLGLPWPLRIGLLVALVLAAPFALLRWFVRNAGN